MFTDLLHRLTGAEPGPPPAEGGNLALAALLVRIARADGDYTAAERQRIDAVLATRARAPLEEAGRLRAEAEALELEASDTVRFTRAIKEAVPLEDRIAVIETLWEVALADDRRDNAEDNEMRLITRLLGVPDVESGLARQRVAARRNASRGGAERPGPV